MRDEFDTELQDGEMLDEIALYTTLIIAAAESPTRLPQDTIDELLQQASPPAERTGVQGVSRPTGR